MVRTHLNYYVNVPVCYRLQQVSHISGLPRGGAATLALYGLVLSTRGIQSGNGHMATLLIPAKNVPKGAVHLGPTPAAYPLKHKKCVLSPSIMGKVLQPELSVQLRRSFSVTALSHQLTWWRNPPTQHTITLFTLDFLNRLLTDFKN